MKTITSDSGVRDEVCHHVVCAAKSPAHMRRHLRISVGRMALEAVSNYGASPDSVALEALLRSARYRVRLYACATRDRASEDVLFDRRIEMEHALGELGRGVEAHMVATKSLPAVPCSCHREVA